MKGKHITHTLEEVRNGFTERGYTPLFDKYNNVDERLLGQTKEGYKIEMSYYQLTKGHIPPIFDCRNSCTVQNIKLWLSINKPHISLLSDIYVSNTQKMLAETKEGYKFLISLRALRIYPPSIIHVDNPYSIDNIKLWLDLNNKPYKLISKSYKSPNDKLQLLTSEGYKVETTWSNLKSKKSTHVFDNHNSHTIENIHLWLKKNDKPYELLSTTYFNNRTYLNWKCKVDGFEFPAVWGSIQNGCGCPECVNRNSLGENHPNWKGGITPLHNYLRRHILQWKKDSMETCGFKCAITGKRFDVIHHLYGFDQILEETMKICDLPIYDKVNKYTEGELLLLETTCLKLHYKYGLGICLTEGIHKLFHLEYKYGNNSIEQFTNFKIRYNNHEFDEQLNNN